LTQHLQQSLPSSWHSQKVPQKPRPTPIVNLSSRHSVIQRLHSTKFYMSMSPQNILVA
jgi:hypothetical protein